MGNFSNFIVIYIGLYHQLHGIVKCLEYCIFSMYTPGQKFIEFFFQRAVTSR